MDAVERNIPWGSTESRLTRDRAESGEGIARSKRTRNLRTIQAQTHQFRALLKDTKVSAHILALVETRLLEVGHVLEDCNIS